MSGVSEGSFVMFGYVIVNKGELKMKDFDTYQSFYCGLCQTLKQEYGRIGQTSLNFDMTFLALLLSGLYESEDQLTPFRCGFHPTKKRMIRQNEYLSYAADMTILLTYLKCKDDWNDEKSYSKKAYGSLLAKGFKRVQRRYPEKVTAILETMEEIGVKEKEGCKDLDTLAKLFGKVMGEIVSYKEDEWQKALYEIGDYLGRFIYIMDAYDDVEEDGKHNQFNPFLDDFGERYFEERSKMILELMIANCAECFETLPIFMHLDILRNILYSGIWTKYEIVRKKRLGEEDGSV